MKNQATTQRDAIKQAFASGLTLSPINAFKETGTMKIATRVGELTIEGWIITKRWKEDKTRFGGKCRFMTYTLDKTKTPEFLYKPYEPTEYRFFKKVSAQTYLML